MKKNAFVAGTFLLSFAGLISRIIGFFYRIFLSHTIGAEGLGIYQLIFPIYALTFSFTVAGIQTAISKYVAEACAKKSTGSIYLYTGLGLSLVLSGICMGILYLYATPLAIRVLEEPRCAPLLRILALTVPFGAIHACINGYYYGRKKTAVPAISQLLEQIARVGGVFVMYLIATEHGGSFTTAMAVWGLVIGEIASVLYSVTMTRFRPSEGSFLSALSKIFTMSLPLTANRVLVNLFQSFEAIQIPIRLKLFGYSSTEALSVYGVLTGMSMPMVLFPSVVTNSVSVMLLPAISEAAAKKDRTYIKNSIRKSIFYCLTLGLACTLGFLIFGRILGRVIFGNEMAGDFIITLGWICPFLYLTTTLCSIINGLGKTTVTFLLNLTASGIRIFFVWFLIPLLGIRSYLIGMLVSYLVECGAAVLFLRRL